MASTSAQAQVTSHRGDESHHPATCQSRITLTKIGNPAWVPVDFTVFAAPIGTNVDGYAEFQKTQEAVLPPPHYQPHTGLGIGPGTPKPPPYNHDVSEGVDEAGYPQNGPFRPEQFSNGSGVYLAYMVVPTKGSHNRGSSPDFARGPIIPNSLFPIQVTGISYRNGKVYDPTLAKFTVPALNDPSVDPPFNVDGHSHFPIISADNADFGPSGTKVTGRYAYKITMQDRLGNGWTISAPFTVKQHED